MSSQETDAIIAFVKAAVPDAVVTAVVGKYISPQNPCDPHSPGSYHCQEGTNGAGLAVDFGGTPAQQLAAFSALRPVAGQLAELIHNPSGAVKNGMWVNGLVVYGPTVWAAHANHTHVAVNKGTFLAQNRTATGPSAAQEVVRPVYDPPLQVVDFLPYLHGSGGWGLLADGGIAAWGDAPYRGADKQPLGHDYWGNRRAAKFERNGDGYNVIDTAGERYQYP